MFAELDRDLAGGGDVIAQNRKLKQRLSDLMLGARQNESKLRKFQKLEFNLMGLNSLAALIDAVVCPDSSLVGWDEVSLLLFDPEYDIQRMLLEEGVNVNEVPGLLFSSGDQGIDNRFPISMFPMLGTYRSDKHSKLFRHRRKKPASVAMLPLVRYGRLIGSLNIGSFCRDRFVRGVLTDFLEHFAVVVAICIENAVNLQRLKRQGLMDPLTAVNNRRFFDQRLGEEVKAVRRTGNPLSCLLLDVDYFKRVNDSYGHPVGDVVLREVAALVRSELRASDVLSRYGGEEFAVLLANATLEEAQEVAERIRASVAAYLFESPDFDPFNITISIGVATFRWPLTGAIQSKEAAENLVAQADQLLYAAKHSGRDCVVCGRE